MIPLKTYIDAKLDNRIETATSNNGDVPDEENMSDVTPSYLKIQKMIKHVHQLNLERPKWLRKNWMFETKIRTTGATARIIGTYYFDSK